MVVEIYKGNLDSIKLLIMALGMLCDEEKPAPIFKLVSLCYLSDLEGLIS